MAKRIGVVWWWGLAALLLLVVSAWAGALVIRQRSLQAELAQARAASAAGKHAQASMRLSRLAERWTNDGEVLILLGDSELARGRNEPPERRAEAQAAAAAALAAWAKSAAGKPSFRPGFSIAGDPTDQHGALHAGRRGPPDGTCRSRGGGSL